jgi:hypothetical protein
VVDRGTDALVDSAHQGRSKHLTSFSGMRARF